MIIITESEISNGHGTGVLLKNIVDAIGNPDNIVLCKDIVNLPDNDIKHYLFDNHKLYKPSKLVTRLLLSSFFSSLYFALRKPEIGGIPLEMQDVVLITIYREDALWATLKIMRLYPNKKYLVYMMDNFIDFSDNEIGRLNRRAFTIIAKKAAIRLAISKNLSEHLEAATGLKFNIFLGPRNIDWVKVNLCHHKPKENRVCLIGNAWVEDALPVIDKQLGVNEIKITWFTNPKKFRDLKIRYNLKNFNFGGSFSSEEVIEQASSYKYGLIIYGTDKSAEDFANRKLQEFSIPSKILDYCTGGLLPIYYGPDNTACFDYLKDHNLGICLNSITAPDFFKVLNSSTETRMNFDLMKSILKDCSNERFKELLGN